MPESSPSHERPHLTASQDVRPATPPPGDIYELSSKRLQDSIPKKYRLPIPSSKGLDDLFTGREERLSELLQRFTREPHTDLDKLPPEKASFTTVVTNPPGVGKSTLLDEFERRYKKQGGKCFPLYPVDVTSNDKFCAAIEKHPIWKAGRRVRSGMKIASVGLDILTLGAGRLAEAMRRARGALQEADYLEPGDGPVEFAVALACEDPEREPEAMLAALGRAAGRGFVFIMDEAQYLRRAQTTDETTQLLHLMGDPSARRRAGLRSGGLLVAGLADLEETMSQLSKSRVHTMRLETLEQADCRKMIRKSLSTNLPAATDQKYGEQWTELLTCEFGDWTHHAHAAAYAAGGIAKRLRSEHPTGLPAGATEEAFEWMRITAAVITEQLYTQALRLAEPYVGLPGIEELFARAQRSGGLVTEQELVAAIAHHREVRPESIAAELNDGETIRGLLHTGVFAREFNTCDEATGYYFVPNPSFMRYVQVSAEHGWQDDEDDNGTPSSD